MKFKPLKTIITYHRLVHKVPGKYYEHRNGRPGHNPRDMHLYPVSRYHRKMVPEMASLRRHRGNAIVLKIWLKINHVWDLFKYRI